MKFTWNLRVFPLKFFFSRLFDSVKKTKTDAFGLLQSHNAFLETHSYTLRWFINNPLEMYKSFYRNCSFLDCFTLQNQNFFGLTIFHNAVLETHLNEFEKKNWSFMRFTLNVREFPLKFFFSLLCHSVKMGGNCSTKEILKGLVDLLTAYKVTSPLPVTYLAIQAHPPMYLIELLTASRAASWRLKLTRQ